MKVILNVNSKNQYSKFNGLTFEVKDVMSFGVGVLGISKHNQVDFSWSEVMVVNLTEEIVELYKSDNTKLLHLLKYVEVKGIKLQTPVNSVDFTIDQEDLKVLFIHTRHAYKGYTFERWVEEVKESYASFIKGKENPKSFSQWINGQIIALT